jgi:hypothetical protein
MKTVLPPSGSWQGKWLLGGLVLLLGSMPAAAQTTGGSFIGSSSGMSTGGGGGGGGTSGAGTGSFLGTSGGLSGSSTSTGGGSFTGSTGSTTTGAGGRRAGSGTGTNTTLGLPPVPTAANPFQQNYYNPQSLGNSLTAVTSMLGNTMSPQAFGNPTYGISKTTSFAPRSSGTSSTISTNGFTAPVPYAAPYVTTMAGGAPPPPPAKIQANVGQALARTSALSSRDNIQVNMAGEVVVLTGAVASARDRFLAEAMARMTPGVYAVRNELIVQPPPAKP